MAKTPDDVIEAYSRILALGMVGVPTTHPAMKQAYDVMDKHFGQLTPVTVPEDMRFAWAAKVYETFPGAMEDYLKTRGFKFCVPMPRVSSAGESTLRGLSTHAYYNGATNSMTFWVDTNNQVAFESLAGVGPASVAALVVI